MSLAWREQLSVGNDLIDSDHKYLIEIINQSEAALKAKSKGNLTRALDRLAQYAKTHFVTEEKMAEAVGYDRLTELHESHEALIAKLDQTRQGVPQEWDDSSVEGLNAFLREWLINHVIREDMLMKPFLKKFSPRFDPR